MPANSNNFHSSVVSPKTHQQSGPIANCKRKHGYDAETRALQRRRFETVA
jgi:hypothetical protein